MDDVTVISNRLEEHAHALQTLIARGAEMGLCTPGIAMINEAKRHADALTSIVWDLREGARRRRDRPTHNGANCGRVAVIDHP